MQGWVARFQRNGASKRKRESVWGWWVVYIMARVSA